MFDAKLRGYIDPPLNRMGTVFADQGISANAVTVVGLGFGLVAAAAIVMGQFYIALLFILLNRFADGLDGAIARAAGPTSLGGFYDITFDFIFYGAIPLAFALVVPQQNALAGAALLFSFYINGSVFLAFSTLAQKIGLRTSMRGKKSFYYLGGLAEGAETIGVFIIFCLFPSYFSWVAWTFAAICTLSAISRVFMVREMVWNDSNPPS
ncbi:Inner membrane protein YnjF [Pseudovibrio axinellae]|uniref:Inner membrane protein YnjF n=1 Tax=Pseudovibrio axinellae TaxID=989403 RepID=A0A165YJL9_9HYPH|nr:CDP-alcohol phosphatidyltransferase family protein [Pseudovibrio axinellae]KZL18898.1 Inner membrane protein YnjF [Pseudovibrio axinellae]SEP88542.1 CDP-alcohol phosphatidyltransferase [Pseudovibrio axinellae]